MYVKKEVKGKLSWGTGPGKVLGEEEDPGNRSEGSLVCFLKRRGIVRELTPPWPLLELRMWRQWLLLGVSQ